MVLQLLVYGQLSLLSKEIIDEILELCLNNYELIKHPKFKTLISLLQLSL